MLISFPTPVLLMPLPNDQDRSLQHARLLKEWMADRGLKAPALAQAVERQGEQISSDYIRKLARGERELAGMTLPLREAVRRALRVPTEEWEEKTGLATSTPLDPDPVRVQTDAERRGWRVPEQEPEPIPDALVEAARLFGGQSEWAGIAEPRWQRYLADLHYRNKPTTPAGWLNAYLKLKDDHNPPEP